MFGLPMSDDNVYFVHNGYDGWCWGSPMHPRVVTSETAHALMLIADLSDEDVSTWLPPAQYAKVGDDLFEITDGNRFLAYGDLRNCSRVGSAGTETPLDITAPEV